MITLPPIHLWNPPFCGDIDMRIAADGTWFYQGTPINRPAMVKLFASILRRNDDKYELVTPVERVGIEVEDAPFIATTMRVLGADKSLQLELTTNIGDVVIVDSNHPVRFEPQANGGLKPYCMVRDGLWAKLTRGLYAEIVDLGQNHMVDGVNMYGIWSSGVFFSMITVVELEHDT